MRRVIDPKPGHRVIGVSLVLAAGRTVLVADTACTTCRPRRNSPTSPRRRPASRGASATSRGWRCSPISTFGHPPGERSEQVQEAVAILDAPQVDFEYDGEMARRRGAQPEDADGALSVLPPAAAPANVLVMPAFHSASISTKMLQELGGATVIGPLLVGLDKPVQIVAARRQGQRHRQHGGAGGV